MIGLVMALGLVVIGFIPDAPDIAAPGAVAQATAPVVTDNATRPTPNLTTKPTPPPASQAPTIPAAKPAAPCVTGCPLPLAEPSCPVGQNCAIWPPHHIQIMVDPTPHWFCYRSPTDVDCGRLGEAFPALYTRNPSTGLLPVLPVMYINYIDGAGYYYIGRWIDPTPTFELVPVDHAKQID